MHTTKTSGNTPTTTMLAPLLVIVGFMLAGTVSVTEAAKERLTVEEDGISFKIDRYDDGRRIPYRLVFKEDGARSTYKFDTAGMVTNIKVGTQKYKVSFWVRVAGGVVMYAIMIAHPCCGRTASLLKSYPIIMRFSRLYTWGTI